MTDILIAVDGAATDAAKLYDALTSRRFPPDVTLEARSTSDGSLGLVDTILTGIGTVTSVAALLHTIVAWRSANRRAESPDPSVSFQIGDARVTIDDANEQTVTMVWELLQRNENRAETAGAEERR